MEAVRSTGSTGNPVSSTAKVTNAALLGCGVVAGPLFILVAFAQALTRPGFVLADHPLSLLSLGNLGWIQIANFVVCGLLFAASAVGMRRSLAGRGAVWGPRLMMVFAVSLIAGGVFVADPAFSFPPGTPAGAPDSLTWHGILHGVAPALGFTALVVATFVFARRFAALRQRTWMTASIVTGVLVEVLSLYPNVGGSPEGRFGPLWVAMVLGFGWASALAAHLRRND
ncbi:MAG TPA: DUF998 domain-containing protein [Actinomycetota bacterium]|nr:DUF998 domain-containing protein [Actinomycetota bacterium]